MKKELLFVLALLSVSANAVTLNNRQVFNAPMKTIDACIASKLNQRTTMDDAEFNADFYRQLGIEIPGNREEQSKLSKPITKVAKIQKGDLVFFRTAESPALAISGIVQTTTGKDFTILYCKEGEVKVGNSEYGEFRGNFVQAVHIATDKDLAAATSAYASLQKKAASAANDVIKQEAAVKKQEENINKAENKVKEKENKVTDAENKLKDAESKLKAAEDDAQRLKEEADGYAQQIEEANANAQSAVASGKSGSYEKQTKTVAKLMEKQAKAKEQSTKALEKIAKAKEAVSKAKEGVTKAELAVNDAKKSADKEMSALEKEKLNLEKATKKSEDLKKQLEE